MKSPERVAKILALIDDCLSNLAPWTPSSDSPSSPSSGTADGRTSGAGEKAGADPAVIHLSPEEWKPYLID